MRKASIDAVGHSPHPAGVTSARKLLGDACGTDDVDVTYYEVGPGDRFAGAYHRHLEREELFVVLSGEATFETEGSTVTASEGEVVYFAPGDWQLGRNDGSEPVEALLVGSPKRLAPVEAVLECPNCETETRFSVETAPQEVGARTEDVRTCQRCGESVET